VCAEIRPFIVKSGKIGAFWDFLLLILKEKMTPQEDDSSGRSSPPYSIRQSTYNEDMMVCWLRRRRGWAIGCLRRPAMMVLRGLTPTPFTIVIVIVIVIVKAVPPPLHATSCHDDRWQEGKENEK
jgi:hypothetical protein